MHPTLTDQDTQAPLQMKETPFDNVVTLWISDSVMQTISTLIKNKVIDPVIFYEATSEELELDAKVVADDLI